MPSKLTMLLCLASVPAVWMDVGSTATMAPPWIWVFSSDTPVAAKVCRPPAPTRTSMVSLPPWSLGVLSRSTSVEPRTTTFHA